MAGVEPACNQLPAKRTAYKTAGIHPQSSLAVTFLDYFLSIADLDIFVKGFNLFSASFFIRLFLPIDMATGFLAAQHHGNDNGISFFSAHGFLQFAVLSIMTADLFVK